jgi:hypothetical protein
LSRRCGIRSVSQSYRSAWSVTRTPSLLFFVAYFLTVASDSHTWWTKWRLIDFFLRLFDPPYSFDVIFAGRWCNCVIWGRRNKELSIVSFLIILLSFYTATKTIWTLNTRRDWES